MIAEDKKDYVRAKIREHTNGLLAILLESGIPPEVVDETMDRFKFGYKMLFESRYKKEEKE